MAANQNVTQLTQQTVSANTSSLFYAVTGGTTDTGLPLSVLVNNLGLTGVPTVPTAAPGTNTTQIASTAYVVTSFAPLASPTFTGTPTLPTGTIAVTQTAGNNTTAVATTAFVTTSFAPLASPTFTGSPAAPTASTGTSTTQLATTAFVQQAIGNNRGIIGVGAGVALTAATHAGALIACNVSGTVTLPTIASMPNGATISFFHNAGATGNVTIAAAGSDTIHVDGPTVTSISFGQNQVFSLTSDNSSGWYLKDQNISGMTPAQFDNSTKLATTAFVANTFAAPPPYGVTTPNAVYATTVGATGTITPSTTSGIVGTTLADNANAGSVGEHITASSTAASLTSTTPLNLISISLTAGDWEVSGTFNYTAAASTTTSVIQCGISTTSGTFGANPNSWYSNGVFAGAAVIQGAPPTQRVNVSTTTTVYLVLVGNFLTSTATAFGILRARRVR